MQTLYKYIVKDIKKGEKEWCLDVIPGWEEFFHDLIHDVLHHLVEVETLEDPQREKNHDHSDNQDNGKQGYNGDDTADNTGRVQTQRQGCIKIFLIQPCLNALDLIDEQRWVVFHI